MFFTSGLAVTPWATTLSRTVQPAEPMIVSLPGSLSWMTRTAKTMVERGEPMNDATEWIDPSDVSTALVKKGPRTAACDRGEKAHVAKDQEAG